MCIRDGRWRSFLWKGSTEKNKAKIEANVKAVLESAEQALAMENAEEQQELTSEEMARRADRILEKMDKEGITPYVKYNMFHAEDKRSRRNNPFLIGNLYYNATDNYYICPMGQHMDHIGDYHAKSELGYISVISKYRAQNCEGCPLRGMCYKGASNQRIIEVNHQNNVYRAEAKRLLTSERGLYHRSNRPIEPEAVFGDIKFNHSFKRFRLKSNVKVNVEFGLVAVAHN